MSKQIIIKFELTPPEESKLRSFINDRIISKHADIVKNISSNREDVRIRIKDELVQVSIEQTASMNKFLFQAKALDLSSGGIRLGVNDDLKLVKSARATIRLDFIEDGWSLHGTVWGLAKPSPK